MIYTRKDLHGLVLVFIMVLVDTMLYKMTH